MSREQVERLRKQYPAGTKICCDNMPDDPRPIELGTLGEVVGVDDAGSGDDEVGQRQVAVAYSRRGQLSRC